MDPALWELYEAGPAVDEVSVILRMASGAVPPPNVRVVSRFGDIYTARIRRGDIVATRTSPGVVSMKAGRIVTLPPSLDSTEDDEALGERADEPSFEGAPVSPDLGDGRGV